MKLNFSILLATLLIVAPSRANAEDDPEHYTIRIQLDSENILAGDRAFGFLEIDSMAELISKNDASWSVRIFCLYRGTPTRVSKNPEGMQVRTFGAIGDRAEEVARKVAGYQFVTAFTPMEGEFDQLHPPKVDLQVQARLSISDWKNNASSVIGLRESSGLEIVSEMPSLTTGAPFAAHSFRRAMRTKAGDLSARELRQYFQQRNRPKATLASFQIDVPNWLYGSAESQYVLNSVHPESTWHRTQLLVNYINNQPDQHVDQIRAVLDSCGPAERAFNGRRLRSILGDNPPPALEAIVSEFSQVMIQL